MRCLRVRGGQNGKRGQMLKESGMIAGLLQRVQRREMTATTSTTRLVLSGATACILYKLLSILLVASGTEASNVAILSTMLENFAKYDFEM